MSDLIEGLVFLVSSGTGSLPSGRVNLTDDEDPTDEDGDIGIGDPTRVSMSLAGEIFSGRNIGNQTLVIVITLEMEVK
ncbi:hypothetical protein Tco_0318954 [Tanacetum coccineum]